MNKIIVLSFILQIILSPFIFGDIKKEFKGNNEVKISGKTAQGLAIDVMAVKTKFRENSSVKEFLYPNHADMMGFIKDVITVFKVNVNGHEVTVSRKETIFFIDVTAVSLKTGEDGKFSIMVQGGKAIEGYYVVLFFDVPDKKDKTPVYRLIRSEHYSADCNIPVVTEYSYCVFD